MGNRENLFAVIRAVPGAGDKVKYRSVTDRIPTHLYYSLVNAMRMHGAQRLEAEDTAKWICRKALAGDRREIWPGIEILIEEAGNAD